VRPILSAGVIGAAWLAGEELARAIGLLPGSLWGMVLLFLALRLGLPENAVAPAAGFLLRWMALFFVPVGVGVLAFAPLLLKHAAAVGLALGLGTLLTLGAVGLVGRDGCAGSS